MCVTAARDVGIDEQSRPELDGFAIFELCGDIIRFEFDKQNQ
jgi:hypothetical protein